MTVNSQPVMCLVGVGPVGFGSGWLSLWLWLSLCVSVFCLCLWSCVCLTVFESLIMCVCLTVFVGVGVWITWCPSDLHFYTWVCSAAPPYQHIPSVMTSMDRMWLFLHPDEVCLWSILKMEGEYLLIYIRPQTHRQTNRNWNIHNYTPRIAYTLFFIRIIL